MRTGPAIVGAFAGLVICGRAFGLTLADISNQDAVRGLKDALIQSSAKQCRSSRCRTAFSTTPR